MNPFPRPFSRPNHSRDTRIDAIDPKRGKTRDVIRENPGILHESPIRAEYFKGAIKIGKIALRALCEIRRIIKATKLLAPMKDLKWSINHFASREQSKISLTNMLVRGRRVLFIESGAFNIQLTAERRRRRRRARNKAAFRSIK